MINLLNGEIFLNDSNFVIKKGLKKSEFEESNLRSEVISHQEYGYSIFFIKPQLIDDDKFVLVLYFNRSGIIAFVKLSLSNNGVIPTWDNWSRDKELEKKDEHDKWLERKIGKPPYKYFWGEISSNYDMRSGSSMITIEYRE